MKRTLYLILGILCVLVGTLGIFIPILPTTPLLLAAAWFFARSSPRFHSWLMNHPLHGRYIRDYLEKHAVRKSHRTKALILLWSGMALTLFLVRKPVVTLILGIIGSLVSIHLLRLRVLADDEFDPAEGDPLPLEEPSSDL